MDRERAFKKYALDLISQLEAAFPGKFYYNSLNDSKVIEEFFELELQPRMVEFVLRDVEEEGKLKKPFSLKDVYSIVKTKLESYFHSEAFEASQTCNEETIPYLKIDSILKVVRYLVFKEKLKNGNFFIKELESLKALEDRLEVEKKLADLEERFYELLADKHPECKKLMEKRLSKYKFYWHEKVYKLTLKALVKRCLKKKLKIPDFSIL